MNIWKANKIPLGISCSATKGGTVRTWGIRGGTEHEDSRFWTSILFSDEEEEEPTGGCDLGEADCLPAPAAEWGAVASRAASIARALSEEENCQIKC